VVAGEAILEARIGDLLVSQHGDAPEEGNAYTPVSSTKPAKLLTMVMFIAAKTFQIGALEPCLVA
jgi:hypothetical protein